MPLLPTSNLSEALIFLQTNLKASIQNDVFPVVQMNRQEGGYFAVPRLVFCYVDFLGAIYSGFQKSGKSGIATTAKAKNYLCDVMSLVDPGYKGVADALINAYRHGTVHLYAPIFLKRKDGRELAWECYKGPRKTLKEVGPNSSLWINHLHPYQAKTNTDVLPISINCLYDDLLQSIDQYCDLLVKEHQNGYSVLFSKYLSAARQINLPKPVGISW